MKLLLLAAVALCTSNLAGRAAESRNPFDVPDHMAETWWSHEEQQTFFTNRILLDPRLARSMADHLPAAPEPDHAHWSERRQETLRHLTNQPPYLLMPDFQFFHRLTNDHLRRIAVQLGQHTNVVLQVITLMSLAGTGDRSAAENILQFAHRKDLSTNDVVALKNFFHGTGIDPLRDKPEVILKMTAKLGPDYADDEPDPNLLPVGAAAPDFEIKTLAGKPIKLSDYRGKTVLLHFWSTSCGPCIGEFPAMTKGLRDLDRKDLVVLAVSLDDNLKTIERAIQKHGLGGWTHLCDGRGWGSPPARLYAVTSIPHDYIIDSQGIIRGRSWREVATLLKPSAGKN